jgi:hypothetical protein
MRSLLSTLLKRGRRPSRVEGAPVASSPATGDAATRDAASLREEILEHGLDADRALLLAAALEREGRLLDALEALVQANRVRRDPLVEQRIMRLRLGAFAQLDRSVPPPTWPPVVPEDAPGSSEGPPVVNASELTVGVLRTGILRHGSVLVRGLVPRARVGRLRQAVDRAFEAFDATEAGQTSTDTATWYHPLEGIQNPVLTRRWRRDANGFLAADSPRVFFEILETVHDVGLDDLITRYLGERPVLSAEKVTLFRLHARDPRLHEVSWHQDGAFLGQGIRTINAWFALSRCGRDAPGMALMPVALQRILPVGEKGAHYDWSLSPDTVAREMAGIPVWRPECEEGDVLLFDHFTLHRTVADEGMPNWRYAFETWFFAPSVYPEGLSTPLVV